MRNITIEQIFLVVIFILAPLINFIMRRIKRRMEESLPRQEPGTMPQERGGVFMPPAPPAPPSPAHSLPSPPRSPVILVNPPQRRFVKESLLRNPRDVRRGIIIMTILGPCRANESPDEIGAGRP